MYEYGKIEDAKVGDIVECTYTAWGVHGTPKGSLHVILDFVHNGENILIKDNRSDKSEYCFRYDFKLIKTKPGSEAKVGDTVIFTSSDNPCSYTNGKIPHIGDIKEIALVNSNNVTAEKVCWSFKDFRVLCKAELKSANGQSLIELSELYESGTKLQYRLPGQETWCSYNDDKNKPDLKAECATGYEYKIDKPSQSTKYKVGDIIQTTYSWYPDGKVEIVAIEMKGTNLCYIYKALPGKSKGQDHCSIVDAKENFHLVEPDDVYTERGYDIYGEPIRCELKEIAGGNSGGWYCASLCGKFYLQHNGTVKEWEDKNKDAATTYFKSKDEITKVRNEYLGISEPEDESVHDDSIDYIHNFGPMPSSSNLADAFNYHFMGKHEMPKLENSGLALRKYKEELMKTLKDSYKQNAGRIMRDKSQHTFGSGMDFNPLYVKCKYKENTMNENISILMTAKEFAKHEKSNKLVVEKSDLESAKKHLTQWFRPDGSEYGTPGYETAKHANKELQHPNRIGWTFRTYTLSASRSTDIATKDLVPTKTK